MRVPVSPPQNNLSISCYEPTSVLELRRSPSPVPELDPHPLEWDEHVLRNLDWDSIMKDLGVDDESVPNSIKTIIPTPCEIHHTKNTIPEFMSSELTQPSIDHHFTNIFDLYSGLNQNLISSSTTATNNNYLVNIIGNNFEFIEELIRAADCIDTQELQLAQVILARLNQQLRYSQSGKPLHRAAFYFKEALHSLLTGSNRSTTSTPSSWGEIVQTIKAYKIFSGINPIPMFNHFTTNQALLELALDGSSSAPPLIHIIDFDIGLGCQYASLMKEMADHRKNHKFLRITAVVPEEYAVETRLIEDNLLQFAQEMKLRVKIEFVLLPTFQMLSFKAFEFVDGEKTAVLLSSQSISQCLIRSNVAAFLSDLRKVNPSVVVFVDSEVGMESGTTTAASSFRRNFVNGLEFYAMIFESLDAAAVVAGGEWEMKTESLLFRPRILAAVEAAARCTTVPPWREVFYRAGMRAVHLSQFADFQAECLLEKLQVRGFHMAKRQAELVLCWHDTALVATSAWRC